MFGEIPIDERFAALQEDFPYIMQAAGSVGTSLWTCLAVAFPVTRILHCCWRVRLALPVDQHVKTRALRSCDEDECAMRVQLHLE